MTGAAAAARRWKLAVCSPADAALLRGYTCRRARGCCGHGHEQGSRSIEDVTLTQANLPRALLATEHRSINGCVAFIASLDYDGLGEMQSPLEAPV